MRSIQTYAKKKRTKRHTGTTPRVKKITLEDIHILAYGEIGLTPYEYGCLTPYEFHCIVKGWQKNRTYLNALMRKHAQIIFGTAGGKEDFSKYWPIPEIDELNKPKLPTRKFVHNLLQDAKRKEMERRLLHQQTNN